MGYMRDVQVGQDGRKMDKHAREQIGQFVQPNIEGLKLIPGAIERLETEGERSSLHRSAFVVRA